MNIKYVTGDATRPIKDDKGTVKNILHICNDKGAWGRGFVTAISKRWPAPEQFYRDKSKHLLGTVTPVQVEPGIRVFNMIAQHGIIGPDNPRPLDYEILLKCLRKATDMIRMCREPQSIHMPRIGCGLAGGRWSLVLPLLDVALTGERIPVYVYDLPGKAHT